MFLERPSLKKEVIVTSCRGIESPPGREDKSDQLYRKIISLTPREDHYTLLEEKQILTSVHRYPSSEENLISPGRTGLQSGEG